MQVRFKTFQSQFGLRERVLQKVAEYAQQVGRERLISISHTEERDNAVITIWYWEEDAAKTTTRGLQETTPMTPKHRLLQPQVLASA